MHAIYSVTSGRHPRPARSVKLSSADKDEGLLETSLTSHIVSEVNFNSPQRLVRRNLDDNIGVSGQGTNMKIIRLLPEPADTPRNMSSGALEKRTETNEARDSSLINPLVIGIAGVCVLLVFALVIVGVLFRRKLLTQQSQNTPPVKINSKEVTVVLAEGEAV